MIRQLDNEKVYYSFVSGANEVILQKTHLNEINVFPVPDGDTGTNLASLMTSIIEEAKVEATTKKTMRSIADAALVGARGNSGIIFAQYINGMMIHIEDKNEITIDDFATSVKEAVPFAYGAISNPVEGTMITVMREWSEAIYNLKETAIDFLDLLTKAFEVAKKSLLETTKKLKVLQDSHVVDAGAKGFVHFVEGFVKFIKTGVVSKNIKSKDEVTTAIDLPDHGEESLHNRYCTEALIGGLNLNANVIKQAVAKFGDSLVIAGNDEKVRLHIHTNEPQDFFYELRNHGKILQQKVDDMRMQYEAAHNRKHKIALVTDSIADLPQSYVDEHQIYVVPMNLIIEDSNYYDKLTITSESFYRLMDELTVYPTSAQPNLKHIENFFNFLTSYYDEIIVLTVSKEMSGTNSVFEQATKKFLELNKKIRVINSKQNSGAEGLLVMRASEEISKGKSFDEIVDLIENLIPKTKILVSVKTLKYMVRSGRVSKVTGIVGKVLNLKPVISIDENGKGIIFDKAFSISSSTKKIKAHVKKVMQEVGIERYAIVHGKAMDRALEYEAIFTKMTGLKPSYIMDISPIVAMSAGLGTVAIAYITK
ncbi:MAG TPA: DegV family protein [Bacilli bacterium]|nr:DegV family protein [Bacilli bacterium]